MILTKDGIDYFKAIREFDEAVDSLCENKSLNKLGETCENGEMFKCDIEYNTYRDGYGIQAKGSVISDREKISCYFILLLISPFGRLSEKYNGHWNNNKWEFNG